MGILACVFYYLNLVITLPLRILCVPKMLLCTGKSTQGKLCDICKSGIDEDKFEQHQHICSNQMIACENKCGQHIPRRMFNYHVNFECRLVKTKAELPCCIVPEEHDAKRKLCDSYDNEIAERCYFCGECVIKYEIGSHIQNCDFALVICDKCEARVPRMFIGFHTKESCKRRVVQCEFCRCDIEFYNIQAHLEMCDRSPIYCVNKCGENVSKITLDHHLLEECPKRKLECKFCKCQLEAESIEDHNSKCNKFPTACPESCGVTVVRENLEKHKDEECDKLYARCSYGKMLCHFEGFPADIRNHTQKDCHIHIDLVRKFTEELVCAVEIQNKRINELQIEVEDMGKKWKAENCRFLWKITNFFEKLATVKNGSVIYSPTFYSCKYGYKLGLQVYPNGELFCRGYVSVLLKLYSGEHDSVLEWPFKKQVNLKLIDQLRQGKDVAKLISGEDECSEFQKPNRNESNVSFGFSRFVSHETLHNGNYIIDDSVVLEVTVY